MSSDTNQTSRNYGLAQTLLLCAFAGAVLYGGGPLIFPLGGIPRLFGGALSVAGLVLLLSAIASIGRAIQIEPEPRADAQLVTRGIYRRLRHPVYTAICILVVGLFLRRPTLLVAAAGAIVIGFLLIKVRFEEERLAVRYPGYSDYKRRTWGILPWPRRSPDR